MNKINWGVFTLIFLVGCSKITDNNILPPDMSSYFSSASLGCSNFVAYKYDSTHTQYLVIQGNGDSLQIDTILKTYTISGNNILNIFIDKYTNPNQTCLPYCSDVICANDTSGLPTKYIAINGTIEIKSTAIQHGTTSSYYYISLNLKGVILQNRNDKIYLKEIKLDSVFVGWLPG